MTEERYPWLGPQVMFGLMYEHTAAGQILLDVGIGTGASSVLFARAGLQVLGMDRSEKQLRECEARAFAIDLMHHDICRYSWPYAAGLFDHVVSLGVLNHFGDLEPIFREVSRVLKVGGLFGFTVEPLSPGGHEAYRVKDSHGDEHHFMHDMTCVQGLLEDAGLITSPDLLFLADRRGGEDVFFNACLAQKSEVEELVRPPGLGHGNLELIK